MLILHYYLTIIINLQRFKPKYLEVSKLGYRKKTYHLTLVSIVSYPSELNILRKKLVFIIGFVYSNEIKLQLKTQCYYSTGVD